MFISKNGNAVAAGKVSRDAELKFVGQKNTPLTTFSIKAGEKPAPDGERPEAIWIEVKCWYDLASASKTIRKGDHVLIAGRFEKRHYQSKDGEDRTSNDLNAEFISVQETAEQEPALPNIPFDESDGFQELGDDDGDVPF